MSRSDFWSRRKAAVEQEAAEDAQAELHAVQQAEQDALAQKSDEEILQELNLPDPHQLEAGDDFKAFLQSAVPDRIKKVALRRLWLSNPVLANVDGLVEYGEDFTDAATVVEKLSTTYQVGKGMKAHVDALLRQQEALETEEPHEVEGLSEISDETEVAASDPQDDEQAEETISDAGEIEIQPEPELQAEVTEDINHYARRKKLRYRFSNDRGGAA